MASLFGQGGHGQPPVTPSIGGSSDSLPSSASAIVQSFGAIVAPIGQPGQVGEGTHHDEQAMDGEPLLELRICKFGCGGPQPAANGFARTVKCGWHCHLCYGAERVILHMGAPILF